MATLAADSNLVKALEAEEISNITAVTEVTQAQLLSEHDIKTAYFSFVAKFGKSYATLDHM